MHKEEPEIVDAEYTMKEPEKEVQIPVTIEKPVQQTPHCIYGGDRKWNCYKSPSEKKAKAKSIWRRKNQKAARKRNRQK